MLYKILKLLLLTVSEKIKISRRRRQARLSPIFWVKEQKCLTGYKRANEAVKKHFPTL